MAALIPDKRCIILASFIFFLANQNATDHLWDQCCHLQGDGATLVSLRISAACVVFDVEEPVYSILQNISRNAITRFAW